MSDRFKRFSCFFIIQTLPLFLSPLAIAVTTEIMVGGASPSPAAILPGSSEQNTPLQQKDVAPLLPVVNGLVAPEKHNLSGLVGKSQISVETDVDRKFTKSMAAHQLIEDEINAQNDEADLLVSIRAGRSFNRESLAALERTKQAKAQAGQAVALLLPAVSVRASRGIEKSEPSVVPDGSGGLLPSDTHWRTD
ncbi:MAG: hypothetical protein Q7U74_08315, partial [Saprospiraceae bacterium]|nr:hypothetical protein [Saprospiraceae bacterium]